MSELRLAFVHAVRTASVPVTDACRRFGISRKTGYKWLARFDQAAGAQALVRPASEGPEACAAQPADAGSSLIAAMLDHSRRPRRCPQQTASEIQIQILQARDRYGWGGRKLRAYLAAQGQPVPSARTTHAILVRNQRIASPPPVPAPCQHFERPEPHDLWQADHKGAIEVARCQHFPLVILDDHSRFLIALHPCTDKTMALTWSVLWQAFAEFGLPKSLLSDNAFGTPWDTPKTLSWFDSQLVLLGINPIHGRPYHPQTQGKVERFNGTLEREAFGRGPGTPASSVRTDSLTHFTDDLNAFRQQYNHLRPHEALGDKPPVSRFAKSPRPRPQSLPLAESFYPADALLRKVSTSGDIRYAGARILAGRGLVGQSVRIEPRQNELAIFFCWKQIRLIPLQRLNDNGML